MCLQGKRAGGILAARPLAQIVEVQESRGLKEQLPRLFDVTIVGHQDDGLGVVHDEARALDGEARVESAQNVGRS